MKAAGANDVAALAASATMLIDESRIEIIVGGIHDHDRRSRGGKSRHNGGMHAAPLITDKVYGEAL